MKKLIDLIIMPESIVWGKYGLGKFMHILILILCCSCFMFNFLELKSNYKGYELVKNFKKHVDHSKARHAIKKVGVW